MSELKYEVIDSFLPQPVFNSIKSIILGRDFPWFYNPSVTYTEYNDKTEEHLDNYYFTHIFYYDNNPSYFLKILNPLLEKIKIEKIIRVKGNLRTRTRDIIINQPHQDFSYSHKGAIYYLNTNNGFTVLNDGTKIESIENRILFFDPSISHSSTTCSNEKIRANININYY